MEPRRRRMTPCFSCPLECKCSHPCSLHESKEARSNDQSRGRQFARPVPRHRRIRRGAGGRGNQAREMGIESSVKNRASVDLDPTRRQPARQPEAVAAGFEGQRNPRDCAACLDRLIPPATQRDSRLKGASWVPPGIVESRPDALRSSPRSLARASPRSMRGSVSCRWCSLSPLASSSHYSL